MARIDYTNLAGSRLASDVAIDATTITIMDEDANEWPSDYTGLEFYCTLRDAEGQLELVQVTARTGSSLTVTRGVAGSSAKVWSAGDLIHQRNMAYSLGTFVQGPAYRDYEGSPVGVVTPARVGEKVLWPSRYVWYIAVGENNTDWKILAGNPIDPGYLWCNWDGTSDSAGVASTSAYDTIHPENGKANYVGSVTALYQVNLGSSAITYITVNTDTDSVGAEQTVIAARSKLVYCGINETKSLFAAMDYTAGRWKFSVVTFNGTTSTSGAETDGPAYTVPPTLTMLSETRAILAIYNGTGFLIQLLGISGDTVTVLDEENITQAFYTTRYFCICKCEENKAALIYQSSSPTAGNYCRIIDCSSDTITAGSSTFILSTAWVLPSEQFKKHSCYVLGGAVFPLVLSGTPYKVHLVRITNSGMTPVVTDYGEITQYESGGGILDHAACFIALENADCFPLIHSYDTFVRKVKVTISGETASYSDLGAFTAADPCGISMAAGGDVVCTYTASGIKARVLRV